MPISGGGLDTDELTALSFNTNAIGVTDSVKIGSNSKVGVFIKAASLSNSTHVIMVQISPDGTEWFDTQHMITGVGNLHDITCVGLEVRCKVTTVEGSASTSDIFIFTR